MLRTSYNHTHNTSLMLLFPHIPKKTSNPVNKQLKWEQGITTVSQI